MVLRYLKLLLPLKYPSKDSNRQCFPPPLVFEKIKTAFKRWAITAEMQASLTGCRTQGKSSNDRKKLSLNTVLFVLSGGKGSTCLGRGTGKVILNFNDMKDGFIWTRLQIGGTLLLGKLIDMHY